MLDRAQERLYTVASRGYPDSGVGSEIPLGQGVVGVAARERTPIRIGFAQAEYAYGRAIREAALREGLSLETEIPLPGLADSRSQLAVPIEAVGRVLGVLFVEAAQDRRFGYDDEDALVAVAGQLGSAIHVLQAAPDSDEAPAAATASTPAAPSGPPLAVRHFAENDSVFLGGDYLIKGVAGSIFHALVADFLATGRTEFSNRELRLDPRVKLPDLSDNLEARLILLARRLAERDAGIRIEKAGRGRLRLAVSRPLELVEVAAP
jgi:adenylate cyclase